MGATIHRREYNDRLGVAPHITPVVDDMYINTMNIVTMVTVDDVSLIRLTSDSVVHIPGYTVKEIMDSLEMLSQCWT